MKTFLVTLELTIGEYEKNGHWLVEAPDEYLAGSFALACESHGNAKYEDDDRQSLNDLFGEMHYSVDNVVEVDGIIAESLSGLMTLQSFDQAMIDSIPVEC